MYRIAAIVLASALSGCASGYMAQGPLPFDEVPYTSPSGEPWPEKQMTLDGVQALFRMQTAPTVTYVELNPSAPRTLVFVHGLGSYLKFWRHQLSAFAEKGYRVIAADMIGYGKSDKPADFPYTMPAMAEVYREILREKGIEDFVLVGHSMGGQTALAYAIDHPGEAEALALVSPAGFEKFSPRDRRWFRSVFTTTLVKAVDEEGLYGSIRYNNFMNWEAEDAWLIEERARVALTPEFDAYAYANVRSVRGLLQTDFTRENLDRIEAPTLIVYGTGDRLIPNRFMHGGPTRDVMVYGAEHIEDAQLVELEGCGHTLQMDCEARFNEVLDAFLADRFSP
jgi:pimeloyl-ACP methyl ester carboxylesterase